MEFGVNVRNTTLYLSDQRFPNPTSKLTFLHLKAIMEQSLFAKMLTPYTAVILTVIPQNIRTVEKAKA